MRTNHVILGVFGGAKWNSQPFHSVDGEPTPHTHQLGWIEPNTTDHNWRMVIVHLQHLYYEGLNDSRGT